jgi:uncharacterized membrane protein
VDDDVVQPAGPGPAVTGPGSAVVQGDDEDTPRGLLGSPNRLFALTDGVFAIAMTLLALDVRMPDDIRETVSSYGHAAPAFYGDFGVFIIAFVITSRFWLANHKMMSGLVTVDDGVLQRTITFLTGICSIPVVTAVLFRFGSIPQAVTFASLILALTTLLSARLGWYLSDPELRLSRVDPALRLPDLLRLVWNAAIFLLAIPIAYLLHALNPEPHGPVAYAMLSWLLLAGDAMFVRLVYWIRGKPCPI